MLKWLLPALAGVAVVGALYVRLTASDPAQWHVDPETAASTGKPNEHRVIDRAFDASPNVVAAAVEAVALAERGTSVLAGSADEGFMTFVQRSALMGYPDYISVRITAAAGDGARLSIYSRSRFGHSDLGVNQARVGRWLEAVQQRITPDT